MIVTKEMYETLKKHDIRFLATFKENGSVHIEPLNKISLNKVLEKRDHQKKQDTPVATVIDSQMNSKEKQHIADYFVSHQIKGTSKDTVFDRASKFADVHGLDKMAFVSKAMDIVNEYRKDIGSNIDTDFDEAKNPDRVEEQYNNMGLDIEMEV